MSISNPEAMTRYGKVRGFTRNGAEIFLGLPYGASTAGPRRFRPPVPPQPWAGVRDTTTLGQRAPQAGDPLYKDPRIGDYMAGGRAHELIALNEPMGEDCLVLNILTPRVDRAGRAILFYIHGGGFSAGSGAVHTLGDRFVAEENVVLVTVNHRLNSSGFLYLGGLSHDYAVGNVGMLDLIAALEWVRDNIAHFGGDPTKVTIFGESGGGAKVSLLMAMPQAEGLFRAAIIQSAAPGEPASPEAATEITRAILDKSGISVGDLSKLQSAPITVLLPEAGFGGLQPGPTADGQTLSAAPWGEGAPAVSANIPLVVGYCKDEASLFVGLTDQSLFSLPDFHTALARLASLTKQPAAGLEAGMNAYRAVYPNESPSDIFFRMASTGGPGIGKLGRGSRLLADAKARQVAPVYHYRMEYDTQIPPGLGAFHTCELPLVNRMVAQPRAEELSKRLASAWAAFARSGDPNHPGLPRWDRYWPGGEGPIMIFNLTSQAIPDPEERAQRIFLQGAATQG